MVGLRVVAVGLGEDQLKIEGSVHGGPCRGPRDFESFGLCAFPWPKPREAANFCPPFLAAVDACCVTGAGCPGAAFDLAFADGQIDVSVTAAELSIDPTAAFGFAATWLGGVGQDIAQFIENRARDARLTVLLRHDSIDGIERHAHEQRQGKKEKRQGLARPHVGRFEPQGAARRIMVFEHARRFDRRVPAGPPQRPDAP